MGIDSFTDDQLLNLINFTIEEESRFSADDITSAYLQTTLASRNKLVVHKVVFLFGYDANKNSVHFQKEIGVETYYIWAKAIHLKINSLLIKDTGAELNEMNRRMNIQKRKNSKTGKEVIGKEVIGKEVIGKERTTSSTTHVLPIKESEVSAMKVANYLLNKIKNFKPNFKQPNIQSWAKDIDLAIRIDKRTEQELIGCIDWIYTKDGEFWVSNVMSGKKLREKFDTMEAQMKTKRKTKDTVVDNLYDNGLTAQEMIKEMEKRA